MRVPAVCDAACHGLDCTRSPRRTCAKIAQRMRQELVAHFAIGIKRCSRLPSMAVGSGVGQYSTSAASGAGQLQRLVMRLGR